jgi:hypothetical protein
LLRRRTASNTRQPLDGRLERPDLRDLAKFTALVALLAILADAAVGHALTWENDPYWTYWITKTFLIATVFGLGTAWLGIGVGRGAVITAVHTLVLTVYYWSLSPVGLPSHTEWLDLEHTWLTGLPIHFGVIYLGYLAALWIWRHRNRPADAESTSRLATEALIVGVAVTVVGGLLAAVLWGEFQGFTWYLVRVLIAVPFVVLWWGLVGRDRAAAIGGGITLTAIWGSYSHFLGPTGLPDSSLRIIATDPPSAAVQWLSYRDEWVIGLAVFLVVTSAGFLIAAVRRSPTDEAVANRWRVELRQLGCIGAVLAVLIATGAYAAAKNPRSGTQAMVDATGTARIEQGEYYLGSLVDTQASLQLEAADRNPRVSPLKPHDLIDLTADVRGLDGTAYHIESDIPMVDDPVGRHTTWWGVGIDVSHHGRSGIGSDRLPAIQADVAIFGLATITANGQPFAAGVPIHVMVSDEGLPGRAELDVGDIDAPVPGLPDGHLRVIWADYAGSIDRSGHTAQYVYGLAVLGALLLLVLAAINRQNSTNTRFKS